MLNREQQIQKNKLISDKIKLTKAKRKEQRCKTFKFKIDRYGSISYNNREKAKQTCLKQMGYDVENKTESEIMRGLPYHKIHDSGHTKYVLTI